MKKYLQNRNERLFNKLFEKQGVKADFEKKPLQEAAPIIDPPPVDMDALERQARIAAKKMIAAGATVERMMEFLATLDATMFSEFDYGAGKEKGPWFSPLQKDDPLNELNPAQMSAWQHIYRKKQRPVREEAVPFADAPKGGEKDALTKLKKTLAAVFDSAALKPLVDEVDTDGEHTAILTLVSDILRNQNAGLTDLEIDKSHDDLEDELGGDNEYDEEELGDEVEMAEVHNITVPEPEDEEF